MVRRRCEWDSELPSNCRGVIGLHLRLEDSLSLIQSASAPIWLVTGQGMQMPDDDFPGRW